MTNQESIRLANKAYIALEGLNNFNWTSYREQLFDMAAKEERQHRSGDFAEYHRGAASVADCARHFVVRGIAEALTAKRKYTIKDLLHIRPSCLLAASLVENYRKEIRAMLKGYDLKALAALDYCVLVQVTEGAK